jgi:hypothetical protein
MKIAYSLSIMALLMSVTGVFAQDLVNDPWFFSAGVGVQANDNRDGTKDDKESNIDIIADLRGDLRLQDGERTIFNLFLAPSVKWHSDPRTVEDGDPRNDRELYGAVGVDLRHMVTPRVNIDLADTATYTDDPDITTGGTSVRQNANYLLNSARMGVRAEVAPKVGVGLTGESIIKRYDEDVVAQEQDEDIMKADAQLQYLMGAGVNVFGLIGVSDFNNESTVRDRGSFVMTYALGAEKVFSPDFTGKVMGGYQTAEYNEDDLESLDSPYGSAEVTLRAASPTRIRLGGLYGFYAPYVQPYSVQTLMSGWAAVDHDVTSRLMVTLQGQYSDGNYDEEGEALPGGSDKLATATLRGNFKLDRVWAITGGYTYENWDSEVRESFDRNLVDLGVKASF